MSREIFEVETGLVPEGHKETFTQWQIKKSMEHLQNALNDMYALMDKFVAYVQEQGNKKDAPLES